ncbi:OmpA family protein [uncultured Tateyamaria sp.]|uniref:OmpA family protein n=1 Tax=uncultured Tateyamaria sp. TaxID=455651 RepID=UPI0026126050|nr:OmpA family protein [uncultured Tateyamaria sp.]
MGWLRNSLVAVLCCVAIQAQALQLALPTNARQTASRDSALDQVAVPVAPFYNGVLKTERSEGAVTRRAYRIPASGMTPLQLVAPMRAQIQAAGYDILLDCDDDICGGFDFRFAIEVLPAPNMYVNIRDYQFISARHPKTEAIITLLASAAAGAGYLQITQVAAGAAGAVEPAVTVPTAAVPEIRAPGAAGDLETQLLSTGSIVLRTLDFAVGTTALSEGSSAELSALATLLQARPGLQVAVVGHTDTVGGLEANISVSRARARAVRTALIDTYGADGDQIEAEGMGYLSPLASNLTAEGREANRRVEVIVVREEG